MLNLFLYTVAALAMLLVGYWNGYEDGVKDTEGRWSDAVTRGRPWVGRLRALVNRLDTWADNETPDSQADEDLLLDIQTCLKSCLMELP